MCESHLVKLSWYYYHHVILIWHTNWRDVIITFINNYAFLIEIFVILSSRYSHFNPQSRDIIMASRHLFYKLLKNELYIFLKTLCFYCRSWMHICRWYVQEVKKSGIHLCLPSTFIFTTCWHGMDIKSVGQRPKLTFFSSTFSLYLV